MAILYSITMVYYKIHNDLGSGRAVRVRIHDLYGPGKDGVMEQINPGGSELINNFSSDGPHKISVRLHATGKLNPNCGNYGPGLYSVSSLTGWPKDVL